MTDVRKINLRIPEELLHLASGQAKRMGVSANQYVLMAIRNFIPFQEQQLARLERSPVRDWGDTHGSSEKPPRARSVAASKVAKVGANQPCPCGSREKYKRCHGRG